MVATQSEIELRPARHHWIRSRYPSLSIRRSSCAILAPGRRSSPGSRGGSACRSKLPKAKACRPSRPRARIRRATAASRSRHRPMRRRGLTIALPSRFSGERSSACGDGIAASRRMRSGSTRLTKRRCIPFGSGSSASATRLSSSRPPCVERVEALPGIARADPGPHGQVERSLRGEGALPGDDRRRPDGRVRARLDRRAHRGSAQARKAGPRAARQDRPASGLSTAVTRAAHRSSGAWSHAARRSRASPAPVDPGPG